MRTRKAPKAATSGNREQHGNESTGALGSRADGALGDVRSQADQLGTAFELLLVLDSRGIIRDVAATAGGPAAEPDGSWVGKAWTDVVAPESRRSVRQMLKDADVGGRGRWQKVMHATGKGDPAPMTCWVSSIGQTGYVVAVGHDMRAQAIFQQRLAEAQNALERDSRHLRQLEARFKLLMRASAESILIVDAGKGTIVDANPAAVSLLKLPSKPVGQAFPSGLPEKSARAVAALLARVLHSARAGEVNLRGRSRHQVLTARAALFK